MMRFLIIRLMVSDIDEKLLSIDSLAIAAKSAAHAIVRNHRLLTSIDYLNEKGEQ